MFPKLRELFVHVQDSFILLIKAVSVQVEPDLNLIKEVERLGFRRQYISKVHTSCHWQHLLDWQFQVPADFFPILQCVGHNRHNLCSTCYWLLFMKRNACRCPLDSKPCQANVESGSNEIALKPRPPPVERPGSASLSSCTTYRRLGLSDIEVT